MPTAGKPLAESRLPVAGKYYHYLPVLWRVLIPPKTAPL